MSGRNDENAGMAVAVAFLLGGIIAIGMVVAAIVALIVFAQTIICFCAWNEPFRIMKFTITPQYARSFVAYGSLGAVLCFGFLVFVSALGTHINFEFLPYILAGGYCVGSIAFDMQWKAETAPGNADDSYPPVMPVQPPQQIALPSSPLPSSFQFASWDDEEAGS